MNSPAGQAAIQLREALRRGDPEGAATFVGLLDEAHGIEILGGGALRHGADGFAAVGAWRRAMRHPADPAGWRTLCAALAAPSVSTHDERAAGWVASGLVPETVPVHGPPLPASVLAELRGPLAEEALVRALQNGASVAAVRAAFADHPLAPGVEAYYRGTICALGPRPLLYLSIVPASAAGAA